MVRTGDQRRGGRGGWLLGLFAAVLPLACGGMTSEDATGDDGPAGGGTDGAVLDDGTGSGTGGTPSAGGTSGVGGRPATGGAPAAGGDSATGGASSTACTEHSDCTLTYPGCCGGCEPVLESQLVAMNWQAYEDRPLCKVECGACADVDEVDMTRDYFIARCVENTCTVVDVRDDYADCATGEDCRLRDGNGCCEECDGSGYIAVSSLDFVSEQACPEILCPACASPLPEGLSAQCNLETGRCEKVQD